MNMSPIAECNMSSCAFNANNLCHTLGIAVGPHAECNTYVHGSSKGGFPEVKGGIGSCLASNCRYNDQLECRARGIGVVAHDRHADCETFDPRK